MGLSPSGVGESSRRPLPPPSPSIPAQPSSSKVGESSDDVEYCQLLKDYHNVQVDLSSTRLNTETLRGELDISRDARQASMTVKLQNMFYVLQNKNWQKVK